MTARAIFKAPVAEWTWAGPYLGFNVGYGSGKSNTDSAFSDAATTTPLYATNTSAKLDGVLFGAQAGYNWQAGVLVAGIEGDLQLSGQRADPWSVCPGAICNPGLVGVIADPSVLASFEQGQKLEWFGTLRGRLGAAVTPGTLAYVTGGLAVGEVMTSGTVLGFDGAKTSNQFHHQPAPRARPADRGRRHRGADRQLDRQTEYLPGSGIGRGRPNRRAEREHDRRHVQLAHHRQHRASRHQLQVRLGRVLKNPAL